MRPSLHQERLGRAVLPLLHDETPLTSVTGRKVRDVMLGNVVNFGQDGLYQRYLGHFGDLIHSPHD